MDHKMSRSPWVIHYDGSSCNGCDIEVLASLTPLFDAERFGVVNTGNPKHADIFLVTGSVNAQNLPSCARSTTRCSSPSAWWPAASARVRAAYSAMPTT